MKSSPGPKAPPENLILPPELPGDLDLPALNRRLKAGEICLDWSKVKTASYETLVALLRGLDLIKDFEIIGGMTIPDELSEDVEKVVQKKWPNGFITEPPEDKGYKLTTPEVTTTTLTPSPAVWTADNDESTPDWNPLSEVDIVPNEINPLVLPIISAIETEGQLLKAPSYSAIRDELEKLVLADLLGPAIGPEEEILDTGVRDRYLVGMLAPRGQKLEPEEDDEVGVAGEQSAEDGSNSRDQTALQTTTFSPSSFGLSFCVASSATQVKVRASWGHYQRKVSETETNKAGAAAQVWKRRPMGGKSALLNLREGTIGEWQPEPDEQPQVVVKGRIRRSPKDGRWTVTLFLVNQQYEPRRNRDEAWLFQPELIVEAPDGSAIFQRRPELAGLSTNTVETNNTLTSSEVEEQAMRMRYRKQVNFAVGHGISVHATTLPEDSTRATRLSTVVVPTYDVPLTEAPTPAEIPGLTGLVLDMKELAETPRLLLATRLTPLADAYESWIAEQAAKIGNPASDLADYRNVAEQSLQDCRRTLARIREGIQLLATNEQAAQAFAFANRAMWQQRIQTLSAEKVRHSSPVLADNSEFDLPKNRSWRPFQLAFILLNLPSLTDVQHPDRSQDIKAIADLLWFPTGGGKTEAYLGLTAYTLGIRRLQGVVEGRSGLEGIAVIMRYTLRLLTIQQFQRAAALICACEMIRREDNGQTWGTTPFRLGLWVGQRTTPNTTRDSADAIKQLHGHYQGGSIGTPAQLTNCPWCGSKIDPGRNIRVDLYPKGQSRTLMYCGDSVGRCPFSARKSPEEGLPVIVVDEEIYRRLPSLLIATVDKFAQMPWNGATQMLFGQVDKYCPRHGFRSSEIEDADSHTAAGNLPSVKSHDCKPLRPPDLIIQDELHLISGPLGTLMGLYESAVDRLSSWQVGGKTVRPKVIASTATIRRASNQVHAIFARQVNIFPPQGLEAADNFFARQRPPSEKAFGRRYLGICASGRRLKAALIRVYVAYLSASQFLYQKYGVLVDPWMTLVGYFNSMNELAGMRRLVEDDVRSRLGKMPQHGLALRRPPNLEELTSRKGSADIPRVLDLLETSFSEPVQDAGKGKGQASTGLRPLDVLLATNMISVGVDVKRLGLMVVAGQPKTTAEYIQATSRVGRSFPGLVCVIYNWARPRDLSHYEQFEHYHATFYQYVEALSVTPFASRARDRGLAALLVSAIRLAGTEFNQNKRAGSLTAGHPYLTSTLDALVERACLVTGKPKVGQEVKTELETLSQHWLNRAANPIGGNSLGYRMDRDGHTINLLKAPSRGIWEPFTCLNSLRDVEPTVNLILDESTLETRGYDYEANSSTTDVTDETTKEEAE